jgi:hypothetical protein
MGWILGLKPWLKPQAQSFYPFGIGPTRPVGNGVMQGIGRCPCRRQCPRSPTGHTVPSRTHFMPGYLHLVPTGQLPTPKI